MPRRVSLPGAEEFFRPTQGAVPADPRAVARQDGPDAGPVGATSGRVRHDETANGEASELVRRLRA